MDDLVVEAQAAAQDLTIREPAITEAVRRTAKHGTEYDPLGS